MPGFFQKMAPATLKGRGSLPPFHPSTVVCDWGAVGGVYDLATALRGILILGATGSGKTTGPAKALALALLRSLAGFLILCSKPEEAALWYSLAALAGRTGDIIEIIAGGDVCFNFIAAEASRAGDGGGLALIVAALLLEAAGAGKAAATASGEGGDDHFWDAALNLLLINLIDVLILSRQPVTLSGLRELASSAPLSMDQANSESFRKTSACCRAVLEAVRLNEGDPDKFVNVKECAEFFFNTWPSLSEKTRSIIQLMLTMLLRPFLTYPLYRIFSTKTTFQPEDTFDGKIIIVNLPVQTFKNVGLFASVLMKSLLQRAIMRRAQASDGSYLRPVVIWADEAQTFISETDYAYQAVARSGGGCTCYIVQNRESLIAKIGNKYKVDSLLENLQTKIFCQNTGETNEWASELLGRQWQEIASTSINRHAQDINSNAGVTVAQQLRAHVEPSRFTTLKRGGAANDLKVETILFKGGALFSDSKPFTLLTFDQR